MTALFEPPVHQGGGHGAGDWLRAARDKLEAAGVESASLDARMLLLDGLNIPHSVIVAEPNLQLNPEETDRLEALLARRLAREPVSRILGWREFYGRKFALSSAVLDPRADTEVVVEAALAAMDRRGRADQTCRVLDIGTGTGAIAITLLAERGAWQAVASDVSAEALAVAADNAARHKVQNRLDLVEAEWAPAGAGRFDLVISNPPYIASGEIENLMQEVSVHDPRLALDGGADGLEAYRAILARAPALLAPEGLLVLEVGAGQAASVRQLAVEAGLGCPNEDGVRLTDLAGHERVVLGGRGD